jgi:hypothetical protein
VVRWLWGLARLTGVCRLRAMPLKAPAAFAANWVQAMAQQDPEGTLLTLPVYR